MRGVLVALAFAFVATTTPVTSAPSQLSNAPTISAIAPVYALQQIPDKVDVDINVGRSGGAWYTSPVWIAIGAIALVLVLLLIVLVARGGGGTTIVKE
jgi:hypothetical protein